MTSPAPSPPAPSTPAPYLLSLPEAAAATGVPIAAIRRYAELKILSPITTGAAVEYYYPTAVLPVLTTLRIMELMGFGTQQLRSTSTSMLHVITGARTEMARERLSRYISNLQARLVEKGPHTREIEDLIGEPAPART
ncbi:hypothetical protein [Kocuria rosea]|uniref:hypothetical protein n=1 Tax=Kocuria rosea TaxID=1275 RepID=UPI00203B91F3|nr:hypothetical protein [Kocuria rosea]